MKNLFVGAFLALFLFEASEGQRGFHTNDDTNTCDARVYDQCLTPGSSWDGGSACSAVYGGFNGNQQNLNLMMKNHFRDSFKFLIMVNIKILDFWLWTHLNHKIVFMTSQMAINDMLF